MRRNARKHSKKSKDIPDIDNKQIIKFLSFSIIILIIVVAFIAYFHSKIDKAYENLIEASKLKISNESTSNDMKQQEAKTPDITFTLTSIGDIMCHNTQYWDAYDKNTDTYDFSYVFDDISYYTKVGDICIGNIETSFAGKERGYSNYPTFNSPDELAYNLKNIGIDIITTAGNHCLDMGFSGLSRTIDVLDDADIGHLGTYKTR